MPESQALFFSAGSAAIEYLKANYADKVQLRAVVRSKKAAEGIQGVEVCLPCAFFFFFFF